MTAGTLTYETKLNTNNFQKGINDINNKVQSGGTKMKSIIGALGITKLISTGISAITNSIDSAISRLDTMNNFPKVMSNLGISATDSKKAIDRLSQGLQGLPTKLDAGALAVQRFTSKNGDVQKSTDIFLALNNAILAGGASTQIQESALEQLSQAYSKGKMDMMEWRTLQQAMPAQLKQVADTMGLDVDALGEMMRQGEETDKVMDEFINTIIDLNENGGKNIKSFKDQAKNATDGIRTNITNMKTAISRGTASIIDAVNKMLKKVNINGIGDLVSKVGKKIESVLKNVAKLIEKLPIESMLKALKKLLPVIEAVVVAYIAYQATLKAIALINIVKNIMSTISAFISLIPAITSAKDAMLLLNMTFSANPIGLIVGAVAGLTAGLLLLGSAIGNNKDEYSEANEKLKEYKDTMEEADKARQEYLDTNMVEVQNYQDLADELSKIVDENGKVKDGYEDRAKFIVGELNEALGLELSMTDGVITNYNELKGSINDVIEAKRVKVLMDAQEEKYNKALDKRVEREEEYGKAVAKTNEKQAEKNAFLDKMQSLYGVSEENLRSFLITKASDLSLTQQERDELMNLLGEYNNYSSALEKAEANERKQYEAWQNNEMIIAEYQTALGYLKDKNYEAILGMYEDTTNYSGMTNEQISNDLQARKQALEQYLKDIENDQSISDENVRQSLISAGQSRLEEINKQLGEQTKAIEENQGKVCAKTKETQDEINKTVKEGQKKTTDEWNTALSDQLTSLTGAKVEFKKTADGHIQAYINGQKEGKPMSKKEAEKFGKDMAGEIDKAKKDAKTAGTNLIDGTTLGIQNQSSQNSAFSAISSFGSSLLSRLKSSLKEHSPSTETRQYGKYLLQGLGLGIEDEENNVLNQIEDFGDEILDKFENAVNLETGSMSFSGTSGSVSQILSANAQFEGTIPLRVDLDGEKIYDNQQKITARKTLQYGGARQ